MDTVTLTARFLHRQLKMMGILFQYTDCAAGLVAFLSFVVLLIVSIVYMWLMSEILLFYVYFTEHLLAAICVCVLYLPSKLYPLLIRKEWGKHNVS